MAAKDDDDFEAQLNRMNEEFGEDGDDQDDVLGGFPGEDGGFPGGDDPEPDFDAEDLFADDFSAPAAEAEPTPDDYEPDLPEDLETDEPDFEEEEAESADGADEEFGEEGFEEEGEEPEGEEEDPFANLDEEAPAKKKSNMVFYGAASVIALIVAGMGYVAIAPMLGGGSAPAPVSQYETEAPAPFQPGNSMPAQIPQPEQMAAEPSAPIGLPPPPSGGNERVQVPGYPTNLDQGDIRPELGGTPVSVPDAPIRLPGAPPAQEGRPALPGLPQVNPGMSETKPALPSLEGLGQPVEEKAVPSEPARPTLDLPGLSAPDSLAGPEEVSPLAATGNAKPNAVRPLSAPDQADPVMAKLEDLLTRFAELEKKIVTEDDVVEMVDAAVAKVEISGGTESFSAVEGTIKALDESVSALEARLDAEESAAEKIAELEARFEEKISSMSATIASYEEMLGKLKDVETPEVKAVKEEKPVKTEAAAKEAAKAEQLRRTVSRQQAEIVALKSRGGSYVPPAKPEVHTDYRLAGLSNDQAWIETPGGVSRFSVGQNVPGIGIIKEFRAMDGQFAVITTNGIIVP